MWTPAIRWEPGLAGDTRELHVLELHDPEMPMRCRILLSPLHLRCGGRLETSDHNALLGILLQGSQLYL